MQIFEETKDPDEYKDYVWDWTNELAEGETIQNQTVTFIATGGTTSPAPGNTATERMSTVWLAGGTPGERAIFSIRITTDQGRILEKGLAVDIVDTLIGAPVETEVERLTRELSEARAQRAHVASGEAVIDVWRDGRRVRRHIPSMKELESYIATLERELEKATAVAAQRPARRPIGLAWRN